MSRLSLCVLPAALALFGCGGTTPPADSPEEETTEMTEPDLSMESDDPDMAAPEDDTSASAADEPNEPDEKKSADPEFPENATVDQAIDAVPPGIERVNVEPDVLAEPLQNPAVYEPCKVGSQHFKLRVAVWNGRAVGIDVDTKNEKLANCIKEQVRGLEWNKKVRSLNTIEYGL